MSPASTPIKIVIGSCWVVAAYALQMHASGRRIMAYAGCIVALVHLAAMAGGLLQKQFEKQTSIEGGVNLSGFLIGSLIGIVLGALAAGWAIRHPWIYWAAQITAVAFLIYVPLFPW